MADIIRYNPALDPLSPQFDSGQAPEGDVSWGDDARALGVGAAEQGANLGAGVRALGDESGSDNLSNFGDFVSKLLTYEGNKTEENMSDTARDRMHAAVTDPKFWEHPFSASLLHAANMTPGLAMAIAPALLTEGASAALSVAGVAGAQGASASAADVYKQTDEKSDEELQDLSPFYTGLRSTGVSEEDARKQLNTKLMGIKPAINAAMYAAGMLMGPAGRAAGLIPEAVGTGLLKRAAIGGLEGGIGGAGMGATGEATHEQTMVDLGTSKGLDPAAIMAAGASSGLEMGAIGALGGAAFPHHGPEVVDAKSPDAAQLAALNAKKTLEAQNKPPPPPANAPEAPPVTPTGNAAPAAAPPVDAAARAQELAAKLPQVDQPAVSSAAPAAPAPGAPTAADLAAKLGQRQTTGPLVDQAATAQTAAQGVHIATDTSGQTEAPATLAQQRTQMTDPEHARAAVYYPHSAEGKNTTPPAPKGMKRIPGKEGGWHYNPEKTTPADVLHADQNPDARSKLFGLGDIVTRQEAGAARAAGEGVSTVTLRDPAKGNLEVSTVVVPDSKVAETVAEFQKNGTPGNTIHVSKQPNDIAAGREKGTGKLDDATAKATQVAEVTQKGKPEVKGETTDEKTARLKAERLAAQPTTGEAAKATNRKSTPEGLAKIEAEAKVVAEEANFDDESRAKWRESQKNPDASRRIGGTEEDYVKYRRAARDKSKKPAEAKTEEKGAGRAPKERGKGPNYTDQDQVDRNAVNTVSKDIAEKNAPHDDETDLDTVKRAQKMLDEFAEVEKNATLEANAADRESKVKLPAAVRDITAPGFEHMQHNNFVKVLVEARKLLRSKKPTKKQIAEFRIEERLHREGGEASKEATQLKRDENNANFKRKSASDVESVAAEPEAEGEHVDVEHAANVAAPEAEAELDSLSDDALDARLNNYPAWQDMTAEQRAEYHKATDEQNFRHLQKSEGLTREQYDARKAAGMKFFKDFLEDGEPAPARKAPVVVKVKKRTQVKRLGGGEVPEGTATETIDIPTLHTTTFKELLADLKRKTKIKLGDFRGSAYPHLTPRIESILRKFVGNTEVHIVSDEVMKRAGGMDANGNAPAGLAIGHDDGSSTILINADRVDFKDARHTLVHEGIHAAIMHALHTRPEFYNLAERMMREVAFSYGENVGGDAKIYGFTDPHEFMSEVLSNPMLMDLAGQTPASPELVKSLKLNRIATIKDALIEFVRRILGLDKSTQTMSVLEAALHTFEHITGKTTPLPETGEPTSRVSSSGQVVRARFADPREHINEAFQEKLTDALSRGGRDAKDFVQGLTQKGKAVESAVNAARSTAEGGKWLLNKFTSLGQIVGANEHDMPHLRGIWEANERTGVISRDLQEKGTDLAGMEMRAQKQNPGLYERFSQLLQRETLAGVDASAPLGEGLNRHLGVSKKVEARLAKGERMENMEHEVASSAWRGRAAHAELSKEYDAIVAEDPRYAMMHEEHHKFYSEAQAAEREDLVNHIVDTFGFRGTDAERAAAVEKVMNGTLNKDEQAELATRLGKDDSGGVEAVKALMGTRALRRVQGPYEPQMRRGEHAIVGVYKVKEPTNGTKIDDSTWEFKSRKEAHDFAVKSGLDFDEKRAYYDPATGQKVKSKVEGESTAGSAEERFQVKLQRQHLSFHENLNDARAELTDMGNSGDMENIALEERQGLLGANSNLDTRGIKALLKSLEQQERYKNASENERKVLRNAIEEAGLRNLTGNRVQSRRIQRKGVYGGSTDSIRNLIDYNVSQANFRARMRTRGEINKGIEAMRADNKARRYGGDVDAALRRSQVANEIEKRVMDPDLDEGTGRWSRASRRVSTWSYIARMLRASHLILHQMHLPMITSPYMAGRHGMMPAYAETMKAWHQLTSFYKAGGHDAWATTVGSALQKGTDYGALHDLLTKDAPDAARLKDMHKTLADVGYTHSSAGIEVSKYQPSNQLGGPIGALDRGLQKADTIFRGVTNATEAINRMAGADAAYRLEFRKLTRAGKSEADAHKLAVDYTKKVIHDTQGVFSNTNAAPVFQNKILKPFLQFKQFPQMMYHLLGSLTKTALGKGANYDGSPVSKLEQMQAIKSLAGILTTHGLMAGAVMGTPQEPLKILVTVAHGLGLTDKDWTDFENAERRAIKSALGEEAGRIFINGLGAEVFGVDVRHRLGMGSLLTWGMPSDLDSKSTSEFVVNTALGAPGSLALDALKGTNKMLHGDLEEGALQAFPLQALRDVRNAIAPPKRKYDYTQSGLDPLKSLLGFTPAGKAQAIEAQNAVYEATHKYQDERTAFSKQWVGASPEQRDAVWREIEAWNAGQPEGSKLTKGDLFKAQHAANRSVSYNRVIGGVTTTPHTKGIAQGLVDLYK